MKQNLKKINYGLKGSIKYKLLTGADQSGMGILIRESGWGA